MGRGTAALLLAAAACLVGCDGGEGDVDPQPPVVWPPGTALAVDDLPIPAAFIEEAAGRVALIYPDRSRDFHLRGAVGDFVLPWAALRVAYPEARERAKADCAAAWEALSAGQGIPAGLEPIEHTGNIQELTLIYWAVARELEVGQWAEPLERRGHFALVQLTGRGGWELGEAEEELSLRVLEFGYLPPDYSPTSMEEALEAARLTVVDPAFDKIIPEALRYKMQGGRAPR